MGRGDYHRWNAKSTTGDLLSISLADMKRHGCMKSGFGYSWRWSRRGEQIGAINFDLTEDSITFRYTTTPQGGQAANVHKHIPFVFTTCQFGGHRKWFLCGCGKRVARLFIHRQDVACRHCFNLAYPTQNGDEIDRAWARINKLEARLEDDRYKPKGMHWDTFQKIKEKLSTAHYQKDLAFVEISRRRFPSIEF